MSSDALVIFEEGKLRRWELQEERYGPAGELTLEGDYEGVQALIAAGGGVLAVALDDGTILLRDAATLEASSQHQPFTDNVPRQVAVDARGAVVILLHNGQLWTHAGGDDARLPRPKRKVTAIGFSQDGRFLLADQQRVVHIFDSTGNETQTLRPKQTALERVQRYIIVPLYTVFPKPGKLKETNAYLLTKPSAILEMAGAGLDEPQPQIDPWTPVWSSGAFTIAMLVLGCIYITRQEF